MTAFRRASTALGAMLLFAASPAAPAFATDIYDHYGPRGPSPYDDPRYGDVYRHPIPPSRYAEPRYPEPRYEAPPNIDKRYDYQEPREHGRRYGYLAPLDPPHPYQHGNRFEGNCVPRAEIRRGLVNEGWRDFHELEFQGRLALINARRPNGQLYALKIDRCSGDIVRAKPLHDRPAPYAFRERYRDRDHDD